MCEKIQSWSLIKKYTWLGLSVLKVFHLDVDSCWLRFGTTLTPLTESVTSIDSAHYWKSVGIFIWIRFTCILEMPLWSAAYFKDWCSYDAELLLNVHWWNTASHHITLYCIQGILFGSPKSSHCHRPVLWFIILVQGANNGLLLVLAIYHMPLIFSATLSYV